MIWGQPGSGLPHFPALYESTADGLQAAYDDAGNEGLITIGPGLSGLGFGTIPTGVCVLRSSYLGWDVAGRPFRVFPNGTERFRADSTGAVVTGDLSVSGATTLTGGVSGTLSVGALSSSGDITTTDGADLHLANGGAVYINSASGGDDIVLYRSGSTILRIVIPGSAGVVQVRDSSDGSTLFQMTEAGLMWWAVAFTHATLPAGTTNGNVLYCSDCTKATPCGSGGTGAFAKRLNSAWDCN